MLEAMGEWMGGEWMGYPMYCAMDGAPSPARGGAAHATLYPYGTFPCGDGKTVMPGPQNEREWLQFCDKVLLNKALASDERHAGNAQRTAHREPLRQTIVEAFSARTAAQVAQRPEDAQGANAALRDLAGLWAHEQLAARSRRCAVDTPAGPVPTLLPPGSWNDGEPRMDAVPALGQCTEAILAEPGVDAVGIAALRAAEAT